MLRRIASFLLKAAARTSRNDEWPRAMLCELEFIEGEWPALRWAIGSTAAVLRTSTFMQAVVHILAGIGLSAISAIVVAMVFVSVVDRLPPAGGTMQWMLYGALLLPVLVISIGIAAALWRNRRTVAVAVLCTAVLFDIHFAMHLASGLKG